MYKSRLQELCQRRSWGLPDYHTTRNGPTHIPRFAATVTVRGQVFTTQPVCRSSKDAQNAVAKIAFDHFCNSLPQPPTTYPLTAAADPVPGLPAASLPIAQPVTPLPEIVQVSQNSPPIPESPLPSALPLPSIGFLTPKNVANSMPGGILQNCENHNGTSGVFKIAIGSHDMNYKDTLHMYKNRLQNYAQKKNIDFPVYSCESEGPPHARRFKSRVSLNGKSYETIEFFSTLKEAEQAAAKVACQVLSVDGTQEDSGLYKNILQEFVQKKGFSCPSYETTTSGMSHMQVFVSTVAIGNRTFRGAEARTKKQAEMNAAKVAYCTLIESCPASASSELLSSGVAEAMSTPKKNHAENEGSSNPPLNHLSLPSSQMGNPSSTGPLVAQTMMYPPSHKMRIVVIPCNSDLPRPEGAEVLPYSDDQFVAYRIEPTKEAAAS